MDFQIRLYHKKHFCCPNRSLETGLMDEPGQTKHFIKQLHPTMSMPVDLHRVGGVIVSLTKFLEALMTNMLLRCDLEIWNGAHRIAARFSGEKMLRNLATEITNCSSRSQISRMILFCVEFCHGRILIHLMERSKDPMVVSVAVHDVGQYIRYYPRGKG